tara:strand:+ start:136 stop:381 length:246 start_codon:yes stop_codon:yes gene_type:complete
MIITFNELRELKDRLPNGTMGEIAKEMDIEEDTVRNYFGGTHYENGKSAGIHISKGINGGYVQIDDESIMNIAKRIIKEGK